MEQVALKGKKGGNDHLAISSAAKEREISISRHSKFKLFTFFPCLVDLLDSILTKLPTLITFSYLVLTWLQLDCVFQAPLDNQTRLSIRHSRRCPALTQIVCLRSINAPISIISVQMLRFHSSYLHSILSVPSFSHFHRYCTIYFDYIQLLVIGLSWAFIYRRDIFT